MQSAHSPSLYVYLYNRESSLLILYLVTSILYHESPFYCTVCSIQIYRSPSVPTDEGAHGKAGETLQRCRFFWRWRYYKKKS